MKRFTTLSFAVFLLASASLTAQQPNLAATQQIRYCVRSHGGEWASAAYQPLIDAHAGQTIEKVTYAGSQLQSVLIREFTPEVELRFEYKFDEQGHMSGLYGAVLKRDAWVYESESFRESATGFVPVEAQYTRIAGGLPIAEPVDGKMFASYLTRAQMFRTVESIPCAATMVKSHDPLIAMRTDGPVAGAR